MKKTEVTNRDKLIAQALETAKAVQAGGIRADDGRSSLRAERAWHLAEAVILLHEESSRSHVRGQGLDPDSHTIPDKYRKK